MAIVDFHTHAFPDQVAGRAVSKLQAASKDWTACLDGTVTGLLGSMNAAGIDRSVVCPIATRPEQFDGILAWCTAIRSWRLVPLGSVHPDDEHAARQVQRVAQAHLPGLKLHPMYQDFAADDFERMDAIYAAAAECGLFVELHCGCDIAFRDSDAADPIRIAAVARRYPRLKVIATHMGGWLRWDAVREHLLARFENVWMETSFAGAFMPPEALMELIRGQGADKVLFGTDSPWADQAAELARLRAAALTQDELTGILGDNAERLLKQQAT